MSPSARPRSPRGHGTELRDEILAAADELLGETASEEAVSIRAVADAVGVTPPSIYRHFPDKTMLLLEVCRMNFDRFTAVMDDASAGADDPVARLRALAEAYVQFGVDHPEHYRLMFMDRYELAADEYLLEMMAEDSSFTLLLNTVRAVIDAGVLRPGLSERGELHVGLLVWSAVHGITSLLVAKPSLPWPDRDRLVADLVDMTLHGILAPEAPAVRSRSGRSRRAAGGGTPA